MFKIVTHQFYNERALFLVRSSDPDYEPVERWERYDRLLRQTYLDNLESAVETFIAGAEKQSGECFEARQVADGYFMVDLEEWDSGTAFGEWFDTWAKNNRVEVQD